MLTDSTGTVAVVLLRIWIAAPKVDPLTAVDRAMTCTSTCEASGPSDFGTTPHVDKAEFDDTAEDAELEGGCEMCTEARRTDRQPVSATAAKAITAHHRPPRSISTHLRCTKPHQGSRAFDRVAHHLPGEPGRLLSGSRSRIGGGLQ